MRCINMSVGNKYIPYVSCKYDINIENVCFILIVQNKYKIS
jgi:hypothetical protein